MRRGNQTAKKQNNDLE
jgi:hypothetical protein